MIVTRSRTVYRSTLRGRDYFSKVSAIRAEARMLIEKRHPTEESECDEYGRTCIRGWHWSELKRSDVLLRRVCRLVRSANGTKGIGL